MMMMNSSIRSNSVHRLGPNKYPKNEKHVDTCSLPSKLPQKERTWKDHQEHVENVVKCVTQDEDEEQEEGKAFQGSVDMIHYDAEIYLERYDRMVQRQEEEHLATLDHVKPLLEILEESIATENIYGDTGVNHITTTQSDTDDYLLKEFRVKDLQMAIQRLLLEREFSNYDFIQTDLQWMMVLNSLTENMLEQTHISWAEILYLYKVSINGMQTLQHIPAGRIRSRTKAKMLSSLQQLVPPAPTHTTVPKSKVTTTVRKTTDKRSLFREQRKVEMTPSSNLHQEVRFWKLVVAFLLGITLTTMAATSITTTASSSFPVVDTGKNEDFINIQSTKPLIQTKEMVIKMEPKLTPRKRMERIELPMNSPWNTSKYITPRLSTTTGIPKAMHKKEAMHKTTAEKKVSSLREIDSSETNRIIASSFEQQQTAILAIVGLSIGGPAVVKVVAAALSSSSALISTIASSSLFPLGFTVMIGTFLGHGIRDFVKSNFVKSKWKRFQKSKA